ncbi:MAG: ATP-binding cassette domain-containing protein [Syntrophomonadaceae bacterium]|nr:ATP-binding cassette domain-containing protein [Syntrophomonadaceae bacterium]
MLELRSVSLTISNENGGTKEILNNIDLTLKEGKFYAVTGPNGGGKTSLAKIIMGIYLPTEGRIYYNGEDITNLSITERSRRGIAYAFQQPPRFKGIRVRDLLGIAANNGLDEKDLHCLLHDVGLCPEDYLNREVDASLSGGEMKRIEIATLLVRPAEMLIFDEPEAGVDLWTFQQLVMMVVQRHHLRNSITLTITHNERFLSVADEVLLIAEGEIKERGKRDQVWPLIKDDIICQWRRNCGGEFSDPKCYR